MANEGVARDQRRQLDIDFSIDARDWYAFDHRAQRYQPPIEAGRSGILFPSSQPVQIDLTPIGSGGEEDLVTDIFVPVK